MLATELKLLVLTYFTPSCLALPFYYQLHSNSIVKTLSKNKTWLNVICTDLPKFVDNILPINYTNCLASFYPSLSDRRWYNLALQCNTQNIRFSSIGNG